MLDRRVEVLFEAEDFGRLQAVARRQGKSVGQLLREAAAEKYLVPEAEMRRAALRRILSQEDDLGSWEDAKDALLHRYEGSS